VFHIAERHQGLLPGDANARARAITWMFAALNTVEPPIVEREMAEILDTDKPWYAERLLVLEDRVHGGWANFPAGLAMPTGWTVRSAPVTC
jgi:glutathione S-transferase